MMYPAYILLALTCATPVPANPAPKETSKPPQVEVMCMDGSKIKVELLDEWITLNTKYGELKVPVNSVKGIEFATRTSQMLKAEIADHVSNLGNPDFHKREKATKALKDIGPLAYPAGLTALKSSDAEVSRRAEEITGYIKGRHRNLTVRPLDIITTDDSKLSGTIKSDSLKVRTTQFGEQKIALYDMDRLGIATKLELAAANAPANMNDFQNQYGKEAYYKVTGKMPDNVTSPSVWGSEPYSLDSNISVAAVHAGLVQPGESIIIKIRVIESPMMLPSSEANGITTTSYGKHVTGAYVFVRE